MKTCTKCNETKPVSGFYKNSSKRGGLDSQCKTCADAGKIKARAVPANLAKVKACVARYYVANKDEIRARRNDRYTENPEKCKAASAKWSADNPDRVKVNRAKWLAENPEALRVYAQNRSARKRESGGKLSVGLADKLLKLQQGKCACCGKPLGKNYHLDHIMPIKLGGANEDSNIQLLRGRCNLQKNAKHPVKFMQQRGFLI